MGVFNNIVTESGLANIANESYIECNYEPGTEAALHHVAESEQNYLNMIKAIGIEELNYYDVTGEEMVYEEGKISSFIETAKKYFLIVWKKIQGLFARFMAKINVFIKSDKAFIDKYKNKFGTTKDFKYKGFKFTINQVQVDQEKKMDSALPSDAILKFDKNITEDKAKKSIQALNSFNEIEDEMRGSIFGESSLTSSEFNKKLFETLRNGEDSKEEIEGADIEELKRIVLGTGDAKTALDKAYRALKERVNKTISELTKTEKELKNSEGDLKSLHVKVVGDIIKVKKAELNIMQVINGAVLSAIKAENRQAKMILASLVRRTVKDEDGNIIESFGYDNDFLSGVNFI